MKINTIILSLVAASTVIAAPAPVQLEKRSVLDKLGPLITDAVKTLGCGACVTALSAVKATSMINRNWVLDAGRSLCPTLAKQNPEVCNGMVDLYGQAILDSVQRADISEDGKTICYALGSLCPAPAITSGTLRFPKAKPANAVAPAPSGQQVDVLHLSDWHVDELYTPGSEGDCGRPTCCRKYSDSPATPKRAAASWGDYGCDTPVKLTQDLLKYIPTVAKINFSIMTGDVPAHDVWLQTQKTVDPIHQHAYSAMGTLPAKVYPAVGNHDMGPSNLADDWSRWLPQDATNTVKNYGAYTASPAPGLRVISLNTNFCYTNNFYIFANLRDYDPHGELKWLVAQLQAAEDKGERVWIIGHVSPSMTDCLQNWSALYYQVIQRYSPHVIAEQFFGHSHRDEFALYYAPGAKSTQTAISTGWVGPSVTPYTGLNPGFRIYKVDTKSWNVFDAQTYIADLNQASKWDASGATPNWHLEYSARKAYGAYVPIADNAPLSASWWHNVTTVFEKNDAAFQQYWTYRGKSANLQGTCAAGSTCPKDIICNLRAGKSSDNCVSTKRPHTSKRDLEAEGSDASGLHTLFKREEPHPGMKNLCGSAFGF
ncbi:Sphingomyelin phosphodiesterase [Mortierella sp. NVP85]|nr:Sphingomyelin phosphodiesterase [Mortierella sp. NVP85]